MNLTRLVQSEKQVTLIFSPCFCFQIQILEDLDEQMYIITLEEEAIQRRLNGMLVLILLQIQYLEQSDSGQEYWSHCYIASSLKIEKFNILVCNKLYRFTFHCLLFRIGSCVCVVCFVFVFNILISSNMWIFWDWESKMSCWPDPPPLLHNSSEW